METVRGDSRFGSTPNLSAFLWARRLKESLAARLRKSIAKQISKLIHG
jgi:hypothetical protein